MPLLMIRHFVIAIFQEFMAILPRELRDNGDNEDIHNINKY